MYFFSIFFLFLFRIWNLASYNKYEYKIRKVPAHRFPHLPLPQVHLLQRVDGGRPRPRRPLGGHRQGGLQGGEKSKKSKKCFGAWIHVFARSKSWCSDTSGQLAEVSNRKSLSCSGQWSWLKQTRRLDFLFLIRAVVIWEFVIEWSGWSTRLLHVAS